MSGDDENALAEEFLRQLHALDTDAEVEIEEIRPREERLEGLGPGKFVRPYWAE